MQVNPVAKHTFLMGIGRAQNILKRANFFPTSFYSMRPLTDPITFYKYTMSIRFRSRLSGYALPRLKPSN